MRLRDQALGLLGLLAPALAGAQGLSGAWAGNDGGHYYLRQIDNTVFWYAERGEQNPSRAHVFHGHVEGQRLTGHWASLPNGERDAAEGELRITIVADGQALIGDHALGGLVANRWTRIATAAASGPSDGSEGPPQPVCTRFEPARSEVVRADGRWRITQRKRKLFDFEHKKAEAETAFGLIRFYGLDERCQLGAPRASFSYLLAAGAAPAGAVTGEDCVGFDPQAAEVARVHGRWKIVDGQSWLYDFADERAEARVALEVIREHGFTQACFVGRPGPSFEYLRR